MHNILYVIYHKMTNFYIGMGLLYKFPKLFEDLILDYLQ